jgi:hypothetical protein
MTMKKINGVLSTLILVLVLAQPAFSGTLKLGLTAGYYLPSDSAYKDLYGQGNLMFGGSLGFELIRKLEIRLEGGYFQDSGKMNLTEEGLKLSFFAEASGRGSGLSTGRLCSFMSAPAWPCIPIRRTSRRVWRMYRRRPSVSSVAFQF